MQPSIKKVEDSLVELQHDEDHERDHTMDDGKDCFSILFGELGVVINKHFHENVYLHDMSKNENLPFNEDGVFEKQWHNS